MTKQTEEALKMAIEALDRVAEYLAGDEQFNFDIYKIDKAYLTCKEALALSEKQHTFPDKKQPAQEPVGYIVPDYQNVMHARDGHTLMAQEKTDLHKIPVYTHPAPPAQEPVAWTTDTQMKWLSDASNNTSIMWNKNNWSQMGIKDNENIIPLYTHPAPQPAQEPVAWMLEYRYDEFDYWHKNCDEDKLALEMWFDAIRYDTTEHKIYPLYTHPAPAWQGLSDDDIKRNATKLGYLWTENSEISFKMDGFLELFARAIEQALMEKNT